MSTVDKAVSFEVISHNPVVELKVYPGGHCATSVSKDLVVKK